MPRTTLSVLAIWALGCSTAMGGGDGVPADSGEPPEEYPDTGAPWAGVDAGPIEAADGGGVYDDDGGAVEPALCPAESIVAMGCVAEVDEGAAMLCNGLDDDCDGRVDESCWCEPGAVQRCFAGPPGRRARGACTDGTQTCVSMGEFGGTWGPCGSGISPGAEACDGLDNDCNGCTDEISGCRPTGSCPGPGDPRVADGRPFSSYPLRGGDFYTGADAVGWRWEVVGTPCDRMFQGITGSTATSENGQLSYQLHGATSRDASLDFTLSGDYAVTLIVTRADGSEFRCSWIVHVRAPGLRVELCWQVTGPTSHTAFDSRPLDIDLHLGKNGTTARWFGARDCHYATCQGGDAVDWGLTRSPIEMCTGPGSRGGFSGTCPNPRLDIDNVASGANYVPENINVDNPNVDDRFRIMVHHYDGARREAFPMVNVYCGGELKATYGAPGALVRGFDRGGGDGLGAMWRVANVRWRLAADGTPTCNVNAIHPPGTMRGYHVTYGDTTY